MKDLTLKLDRNDKIIDLLSQNIEILNKVSRFQTAVKQLEYYQKKLLDFISRMEKDLTILEKDKDDQREALIELLIPVIRIMQVFAHDRKKENLQQKLYFLTPENIQDASDTELVKISKKIWLAATKFGGYSLSFSSKIKSLLDSDNSTDTIKFEKEYGLSPNMIKNLEKAILSFIKSMVVFQGEKDEKEKLATKVKKFNRLTKKLISNKIDRFAILFESENPDFYQQYCEIRGDKLKKQEKESLDQESDPIDILAEEPPISKVKPKRKPKSPKKLSSEK
jgi:hypothetical protein